MKVELMSTIVAQASANGQAGIGIVRISGERSLEIAQKILAKIPKPRYAYYGDFYNNSGQLIDKGVAIFFKSPHSYTGEDVLELQAHGSPLVLNELIDTALGLGAVLAEPGEFSKRAVLNGKMDLTQAEAVADLIASSSKQSAQSALRSLSGVFSKQVNSLVKSLTTLRVLVEASIDFSEDEIDTLDSQHTQQTLADIDQQLGQILANANEGTILREGVNIVIIGKPNAGKSSLLNLLAQQEAAIVTDIAGTTRDIIKENIQINGLPVHILDTAGLQHSVDVIEQAGIFRTHQAMHQADCLLLVYDAQDGVPDLNILPPKVSDKPILLIRNKIDIPQEKSGTSRFLYHDQVAISIKTQAGIEVLKTAILKLAGTQNLGEHTILARKRHIRALQKAKNYLDSAQQQLADNCRDLLAEDLKLSANALGEITGTLSSDDLLGEIFSQFCIGK